MTTPQKILELLELHTNVLLYGPPGTGKSHLMKEVENLFVRKHGGKSDGGKIFIDTQKERAAIEEVSSPSAHSRWVTFHQGYSYEDFVIGLRPVPTEHDGKSGSVLSLRASAGALIELAAYSRKSPGLLLVDEINRGNASRIFGEFITLMESDKRLGSDGKPTATTVTVTLPYLSPDKALEVAPGLNVERDFQMPRSLYTLASMNSVDKSVAPIDAAIRRRFYVCQLRPTAQDWDLVAGITGAKNEIAALAVKVMAKINRGIGLHLGPDYELGQHYLPSNPKLGEMDEAAARDRLLGIWRHKVLPQLIEYLHGRPQVCLNILGVDRDGGNSGVEPVWPTDQEIDDGASMYVLNHAEEIQDDLLFKFLQGFASGDQPAPVSEV